MFFPPTALVGLAVCDTTTRSTHRPRRERIACDLQVFPLSVAVVNLAVSIRSVVPPSLGN